MLEALEHALSHGQRAQTDRLRGQSSLFGEAEAKPENPPIGDRGVREERAAAAGEGRRSASTSRSTRWRRSATSCGARRTATLAERRAPPRRRDRDRRRDRQRAQAADDEEGRADGLHAARRRARQRRGRRLQLGLRGRARAAARPTRVLVVKGRIDHKEGETKLIALEVDRRSRRSPERKEVTAQARRAPGAGRAHPRARRGREGLPRRGARACSTSSPPTARSTFQLGPDYKVKPEPDFFAEVKALLGEAAVA